MREKMNTSRWLVAILLILNTGLVALIYWQHVIQPQNADIPNLIGTWKGPNFTVSEEKGYREWGEKIVRITEQNDRRFRGTFTYPDGTKNFFGVIYPDNISITWVSTNSRGFNHGRILSKNTLSSCYVEAWEKATAGCAVLERQ
jgi:hypothetical protein